jgi:hypothetical protein
MPNIWVPGDPMPEEWNEFSFVSWINKDIAISSYDVAEESDLLEKEEIDCIVSIGEFAPKGVTQEFWLFPNIEDGSLNISFNEIEEVVGAIEEAVRIGKTLVHCTAGVSRSPAFVTLYLAISQDLDWEEAKEIVYEGRECANIHPYIELCLIDWLENYLSEQEEGMYDDEIDEETRVMLEEEYGALGSGFGIEELEE